MKSHPIFTAVLELHPDSSELVRLLGQKLLTGWEHVETTYNVYLYQRAEGCPELHGGHGDDAQGLNLH